MKRYHRLLFGYLVIGGLALGCGSSYNARYEAEWKEIVQSDTWKASLNDPYKEEVFPLEDDGADMSNADRTMGIGADPINARYHSWVSRAYNKIITEAEAADRKIKSDYERFLVENPDFASSADENVRRIASLYRKKFSSHKTMLDGLKSWHAFDEYGSDDLDFFMLEHQEVARAMYRNGMSDKEIIDYLVYKLADLYHLDQHQSDY